MNYNVKAEITKPHKCFCHVCGGAIDTTTKKCNNCGKQYFKGVDKKILLSILFGIIILVLLSFNIIQHVNYTKLANTKNKIVTENNKLKKEVKKQKKAKSDEYSRGHADGYDNGYEDGYDAGYSEIKPQTIVQIPSTTNSYNSNDETCMLPGCDNSPANNSFYCTRHECFKLGCHNQKANDLCLYCTTHKCAVPNCNSAQSFNSLYCLMHEK